MEFALYLKCFLVALIGLCIAVAIKMKSLQNKANIANIEFDYKLYFKKDSLSIIASFLTIILFLFFIDMGIKLRPAIVDYILPIFAFIGYVGSDLAIRVFSVMNKQMNNVIDEKTSYADKLKGTEDTPTSISKEKGI